MNLGPVAKALVGASLAVLLAVKTALDGDGGIDTAEWLTITGTLIVSAAAVYAVRNTVRAPYVKAIAAAVTAGLGSAATALVSGDLVSATMIVNGLIALVSGLVVSQVPNAVASDPA